MVHIGLCHLWVTDVAEEQGCAGFHVADDEVEGSVGNNFDGFFCIEAYSGVFK